MDHLGPFESWDEWFSCIEAHCRLDDDHEEVECTERSISVLHGDGNVGTRSDLLSPASPFNNGSSLVNSLLFQSSYSGFSDWPSDSLGTPF